jgi:hypothetical protein
LIWLYGEGMDAATLYLIVTLQNGREQLLARSKMESVIACETEAAAIMAGKRRQITARYARPGTRLEAVCGLPAHMITRDHGVSAG